jgi:hypothetical protein
LRIVAADSGSAILDESFMPQKIVAAASIRTGIPYRNASVQASKLLMEPVDQNSLIVTELRMCRDLLRTTPADVVHLDMSLGGIPVSQLSVTGLQDMRISSRAKERIREVLPELRRLASEIEQEFHVEVLAIGKESVAVRIAELTAGAFSVIYASEEALRSRRAILLGLPALCTVRTCDLQVTVRSLQQGEHDLMAYADDAMGVTQKVSIDEFNNPTVRGFRVLRIAPREP